MNARVLFTTIKAFCAFLILEAFETRDKEKLWKWLKRWRVRREINKGIRLRRSASTPEVQRLENFIRCLPEAQQHVTKDIEQSILMDTVNTNKQQKKKKGTRMKINFRFAEIELNLLHDAESERENDKSTLLRRQWFVRLEKGHVSHNGQELYWCY